MGAFVTDSWTLDVAGKRPPRPGEGHWAVLQRAKKQWVEYLGWQALSLRVPRCLPGERRRVDITFYRPGPVSDKDNAYSACKVPLDALVRCGLIEDDSPNHIDLVVKTIPAGRSRTVIVLTRV